MRKCYPDDEEQRQFQIETKGASFLFDEELMEFIDEVWKRSIDMWVWRQDELPSTHAQEKADQLRWFAAEFGKLNERFSKYLRLAH